MNPIRMTVFVVSTLLLAACAPAVYQTGIYSGNLSVGTVLELREPLAFRAERSRVFLQDGEVIKQGKLNRFAAHCNFESTKLAKQGDVIEPDTFRILRVEQSYDRVVMANHPMVASNAVTARLWDNKRGPTSISRYYSFYLDSSRQPEIFRMTCHGAEADQPEARLPTRPEIESVLGEKVHIQD